MLNILSIEELRIELKYEKNFSVKRWCYNNGVEIYYDNGCKSGYVIRSEYFLVRFSKFLKKIQKQFPKNWEQVFNAHQNNDIMSLLGYETNPSSVQQESKYKPKGKIEHELWSEWNKKITG